MKTYVHFLQYFAELFSEWETFQTKVVEKIKRMFCIQEPSPQKSSIYKTMWQNTVEPDRPQITIQRMHIACWIPKSTNTHS